MLESLFLSWRLCVRHWVVYRKDFFANISPTLFDPVFYILSIGMGLGSYVNELHGMRYVEYIAPGLAIATAMFTAFFETSYGFFVRMTYEGVYKAILTTPLGVREIILGEAMWVAIKGAGMSFMATVVFVLLGVVKPYMLWTIPLLGIVVALGCAGIGLIATSLVRNINQFQTIYTFLISPVFFFSGIFFPVKDLPPYLQLLAHLSPLYHGVLLAQSLLWQQDIAQNLLAHLPPLLALDFIFCWFGYRLIYKKLYQ